MKSKNIPADIRTKTIKEAQNEIKELIVKLESNEINLKNSQEEYNRMIQLNYHIKNQLKKKAEEIKNSTSKKEKKSLSKL